MMLSPTRERGAVNIILFVMVLVVAIAGWVLWYTQFKRVEDLVKDKDELQVSLTDANNNTLKYQNAMKSMTDVLGVGDLPAPSTEDVTDYSQRVVQPKVQQLRSLVDQARALFKGDEAMARVVQILDPADQMIKGLESRVSQLERELETAKGDRASAEQAADQLVRNHGAELQRRNDELNSEKERAAQRLRQAESQNEDSLSKLTDITERFDQRLAETRRELDTARNTVDGLDRDVRALKTTLTHERVRNQPDGRVIEVDAESGLCWIDLGSRDQVRRGTRFRTYGLLKGGVREYHGFITVKQIESRRALCAIEPEAMPVAGDFATNPYYDRDRQQVFYFLGSLPGRFDNQRAAAILRDFGAKVTDTFDLDVDFVVLGDNPDPEAAVGEDADPNWFKATTEYTDALRWGIEMLRARDLEDFLQY